LKKYFIGEGSSRSSGWVRVNKPLLTRLIHISPSYGTIYRSFEIIFELGLSIGLEFKFNVLCKSIALKKHSIWYELNLKKYLIAEGSSGSNGSARVMRERTYSKEGLLRKKMKSRTQSVSVSVYLEKL